MKVPWNWRGKKLKGALSNKMSTIEGPKNGK